MKVGTKIAAAEKGHLEVVLSDTLKKKPWILRPISIPALPVSAMQFII